MFKKIPKSDISQKNFKVYKQWSISQVDSPVIYATNEVGMFDLNTSSKSQGLYVHPLFHSIKSKYYSSFGNLFTQYGLMTNPADWATERYIDQTIYIIQIPQSQYGEQIKNGSVSLQIAGLPEEYVDNSWGWIISKNPTYNFVSYDAETQIMVFNDGTETFEVVCSYMDINSGIGVFTIDGLTEDNIVYQVDFETGYIILSNELLFSGDDILSSKKGNVFYDDGLIVLTNESPFINYTLNYKSTQTIYETEILVSALNGEFNYSQNPSAVDVVLRSSYDFTTTPITNVSPAKTIKIKDVSDIKQKQFFSGSVGSVTGSWDDYYEYGIVDPTGSYLSTYISTIGLYDDQLNMVAVAKLPKPIKKLPNYNLNFLIRFDT